MPPDILLLSAAGLFFSAPEVEKFMRDLFISDEGPFHDRTHSHLRRARLKVLWTNNEIRIGGDRKAVVAMMPQNKGLGKLDKDLWSFMMRMFFRVEPHFLIILDARLAARASDREFLLTCSHELTHCAQERKDGVPQYRQGVKDYKDIYAPKFKMRPHDHEIFTSDLRFGARAVLGPEAVDAVLRSEFDGPEISDDYIRSMCGTCAMV